MMDQFDASLARLLNIEGGYSNHRDDRGGPTHWGITYRVARANGYTDSMEDMPLSVARQIYRRQYWDTCKLDRIASASDDLADRLFDIAVNMGVAIAGRILQRALNVFNRGEEYYRNVPVDGVIGPVTIAALTAYLARRRDEGERVLVTVVTCLQAARYIDIAESDSSQESFVYGWIRQRILGTK